MTWAAFWLGLYVGSFLNVCVWRMPREQSVVRPRSHCPRCQKSIAWRDNIPVLSYLLLRGRCRHCRKAISLRYPALELMSGILAGALWWRWPGSPWAFLAFGACSALLVVAFIDWDTFLIPDELSLGLLAAGLLSAPVNPSFQGPALGRIGWSLAGAAAGFLLCWAVAWLGELIFKKEAMGGGDIKLLAAVGAWTGALGAVDCLILASLFGSLYGGGLLWAGKLRRRDPIPFGPFLSAGAVFNFFYILPFGFPLNF